jgi:hypothetical protein
MLDLAHQRLVAATSLECIDGEGQVNVAGAHPYVLPTPEPTASGLFAYMDSPLQIVIGGGAGVVVLEVSKKLHAHIVPGFDAILGESVEPLPGVAIH